jgi:hypothetical protein
VAPRRIAVIGLLAVSCGRETRAAPRPWVLGAVRMLLTTHGDSRARLARADALFRDGRLGAPAYAAELDYQLTVREQCRRDGGALLTQARGDAALAALVADVLRAVELSTEAVQLRRALVAESVPHWDAAAWGRADELEAVVAARCNEVARRLHTLAAG